MQGDDAGTCPHKIKCRHERRHRDGVLGVCLDTYLIGSRAPNGSQAEVGMIQWKLSTANGYLHACVTQGVNAKHRVAVSHEAWFLLSALSLLTLLSSCFPIMSEKV